MMKVLDRTKNWFLSQKFVSFALSVIIAMLITNAFHRERSVRILQSDLREFQLSRLMLNSRAQIQIILLGAALEDRKLNAGEIDTVKRLWKDAEYDRAYETDLQKK